MDSSHGHLPLDCAQRALAILPPLRQWVASRVQSTGDEVGVSLRQFAALRGIREGATSPGELARLWQVTPAVITGIVDRLQRRDLVRREPDPHDRRRLRLALTASGQAASDEINRALLDDLADELARAKPEELDELRRSLDLLHRAFSALQARAPRATPPAAGDDLPIWDMDGDEVEPAGLGKPPRPRRNVMAAID